MIIVKGVIMLLKRRCGYHASQMAYNNLYISFEMLDEKH